MQLLEYEAKRLIKNAGALVPNGYVIFDTLNRLDLSYPIILKSQVPVGGRGKAGGVQILNDVSEFIPTFSKIKQTKIKGHIPELILAEEALEIEREMYLALRVNRDARCIEYLVSKNGGIDIEENADSVQRVPYGEKGTHKRIAVLLDISLTSMESLLISLEQCFINNDMLLCEINPLVLTKEKNLICADAKIIIDDNARFRHPDLPWSNETSLKPLGGTIGVIANGAGMAMSTMDTIYAAGGKPANFLDIGGGTGEEVFVKNLRDIIHLPGVTSIIINIFAGITRCDDIARGIISAKKQLPDLVPLFIRLEGTNRDEAVAVLKKAEITIEPDLISCVRKAIP